MVTSLVILTKFSLASMYCDRLIAVFLGASNPQRPDAFRTSLYDNLNLDQLSVHRLQVLNLFMFFECETGCHHERRGGVHGLCPTCRQLLLGYRPMKGYRGRQGMSLGTAMGNTTSVAPTSPSCRLGPALRGATQFAFGLYNGSF
jgi:hypothetical protein